MLSRAAPGVRVAGRDLHRVRLLLVLLRRPGSSTRRRTRTWRRRGSASGPSSRVVEIASNDGYLLQYFVRKGIPVLGVEPAANVAKAAVEKGVPTVVRFFGRETAADLRKDPGPADLIVGNNVLAHVPDINDFVGGPADPARVRRRDHDGVPAPLAADRGEPVRHDLPRALLVPLLLDGPRDLRGARPAALRRRAAPDARRLAAHLRVPCASDAAPTEAARRGAARGAEEAGGFRTLEPLPLVRAARRGDQARAARLPHRGAARREADRRLRRARARATRS